MTRHQGCARGFYRQRRTAVNGENVSFSGFIVDWWSKRRKSEIESDYAEIERCENSAWKEKADEAKTQNNEGNIEYSNKERYGVKLMRMVLFMPAGRSSS